MRRLCESAIIHLFFTQQILKTKYPGENIMMEILTLRKF